MNNPKFAKTKGKKVVRHLPAVVENINNLF